MLDDYGDFSDAAATFGDRMTAAREAAGLSQQALARQLGVRVATIRNWETDRSEPRANRLQMLAGALGVSMVWLITGEGEGPTSALTGQSGNDHVRVVLGEVRALRDACQVLEDRLARLERRLAEQAGG